MLFDTTHPNKDYTKAVKETLGDQFSLIEKIKLGGIGSSRLVIKDSSEKIKTKKYHNQDINYANIELRSKGIIIHINQSKQQQSWIIPYYKLHIYNTECISFHSDGNYIKLLKNKNYLDNKKFIAKLTDLKNKHLGITSYYQY